MSDLDKKLEEALETIIENGKFVSAKEFIVFITEHFDPEHSENPMRERLTKAQAKIKQAFIDDGWMDIPQELKDTGETLIITTQNQHAAVLRQNGYMTKDEWERQAIKDGWAPLTEVAQVIEQRDTTHDKAIELVARLDALRAVLGVCGANRATGGNIGMAVEHYIHDQIAEHTKAQTKPNMEED